MFLWSASFGNRFSNIADRSVTAGAAACSETRLWWELMASWASMRAAVPGGAMSGSALTEDLLTLGVPDTSPARVPPPRVRVSVAAPCAAVHLSCCRGEHVVRRGVVGRVVRLVCVVARECREGWQEKVPYTLRPKEGRGDVIARASTDSPVLKPARRRPWTQCWC